MSNGKITVGLMDIYKSYFFVRVGMRLEPYAIGVLADILGVECARMLS